MNVNFEKMSHNMAIEGPGSKSTSTPKGVIARDDRPYPLYNYIIIQTVYYIQYSIFVRSRNFQSAYLPESRETGQSQSLINSVPSFGSDITSKMAAIRM